MESVINNKEMAVVKTERYNIDIFTDTSFRNTTLIDSPAKINKEVLSEFSSKSRPINLFTLNRRKWTTTICNFDHEFIHVMSPDGFKIFIGELVIVEFPTGEDKFIIQTVQHKYAIQKSEKKTTSTVLSLKFLDPRMDKRYTVPPNTTIHYQKIDHDAFWITDSKYLVVRNTGYRIGDKPDMIVQESIGLSSGSNADGVENISYLAKEINELKSNMTEAVIKNISAGGCAIMVNDNDMKPGALLLLSIMMDISDIMHKYSKLELLLFAVVRNTMPAEGGNCKYGIKFVKRLDNKILNAFLKHGQPV